MKIKKKFLSLIALLFPFIISIGFASWIIVYTIEFNTEYQKQPVSELYGLSQSVVYNGEGQVPMPLNGVTLESLGISEDEITYTYKLTKEKENVFNDNMGNKPIDVGEYDVRISINDNESDTYDGVCQVKFTITKRQIKLSSYLINVNYGELSYDNIINDLWNIMLYDNDNVNVGERTIQFLDKDGLIDNTLPPSSYTIKSIHNGLYYYGEEVSGLTEATRLIGSTYVCTIELNSVYKNNYEFIKNNGIDGNKIIIKYKTALIGSTYYTIEDAISSGQSPITFAGDSTNNSSYVETCFTALSNSDGNPYGISKFNLNSGKTLLVPFTNSILEKEVSASDVTQKNTYVYSVLRVPNGITLNVYGNLIIGARIHYDQPGASITGYRGVLINDGTINFHSGAIFKSYGYAKGDGVINLENGSKATEVLRIYDFPGGSATLQIYSKIFPINTWSVNNISCKTYIKDGSQLYGHAYISVTGISVDEQYLLIGKSSDENCIFKSSGDSSNYILKYGKCAQTTKSDYDPNSLFEVTGNNQMAGNRCVFDIKGNYLDAEFKMEVNVLASFSTGTSKSLPTGFLDINLKSGSNLTLSKSDYLFLPGSKVTIENGAIANIGKNVDLSLATVSQVQTGSSGGSPGYMYLDYCVDNNDAELLVNGQLIISGNIGGKIKSSNVGSVINFTSTDANASSQFSSLFSTAKPYYYSVSKYNAMGVIGSEDSATFSQGNYYICAVEGSRYFWKVEDNVTTFTINFYDSDKSTLLNSVSIGVAGSSYVFSGNETDKPIKKHYEFSHWCDWDGNAIPEIGKTYSSTVINVYAQWNEVKYDFYYVYFIENSDGTLKQITETDIEYQNLSVNIPENYYFTISSFVNNVLTIPATASYTNKYFYGWYLYDGESLNDDLLINNSLDFSVFEQIVDLLKENGALGDTIPLCCKFVENQTYDIKIIPNISGETEITLLSKNITDEITLTNYSSYSELDNTKSVKFICWSVYENDTENRFGLSLTVKVQNILDQIDSCNELNPETIKIENNVLYIYGIVEQKCAVMYQEVNYLGDYVPGTQKTSTFWYLPGQTFNYKEYYDKSIVTFNQGTTAGTYYVVEYSNGGTIDTTNHTILIKDSDLSIKEGLIVYYKYYRYCNVSFDTSYATITATYNNNQYKASFVAIQGSTITFTVAFDKSYERTVKVNDGDNLYSNEDDTYDTTIIDDTTITASSKSTCLVEGTLITMYDGSKKKIEDLVVGDKVLSYNHFEGKFEVVPLIVNAHACDEKIFTEVLNLIFSNGSELRIVNNHGLFDITLNKYIYIDKNNVQDFIGHAFYASSYSENSYSDASITLENYFITEEYLNVYSPVTYYNMNLFANDILTFPTDVNGNIFKFSKNLKYVTQDISDSISKYGLFTYEDFKDYISYEVYLAFPMKYYKIAIGKDLDTFEGIISLLMTYVL